MKKRAQIMQKSIMNIVVTKTFLNIIILISDPKRLRCSYYQDEHEAIQAECDALNEYWISLIFHLKNF